MTKAADVAWEKIVWAMGKRDALDNCLSDYKASKPYRVLKGPDGKKKLEISEPPPIKLSIILGEMVYQFRSALDHLFFELVERNHENGQLNLGWERQCQFPVNTKLPDGCAKPPVPRKQFNCGVRCALTDDAFTFIEKMQPYYPNGASCPDEIELHNQRRLLYLLTKAVEY